MAELLMADVQFSFFLSFAVSVVLGSESRWSLLPHI